MGKLTNVITDVKKELNNGLMMNIEKLKFVLKWEALIRLKHIKTMFHSFSRRVENIK